LLWRRAISRTTKALGHARGLSASSARADRSGRESPQRVTKRVEIESARTFRERTRPAVEALGQALARSRFLAFVETRSNPTDMNALPDRSEEAPTTAPAADALPPTALSAALGAGIAGALAWGAVVHFTNYEIGYLAWGIGALIGWAAGFMGARGKTASIAAAVIALVSIVGGRYLGLTLSMGSITDEARAGLSADMFAEYQRDATDWSGVDATDDAAVRAFMVTHAWAEEPVPAEDLAGFKTDTAPLLAWMHASNPSLEQWRDRLVESLDTSIDLEVMKSSFSAIDLLFAFLGISTAYGLVMRRSAT